MLTLGSRRQKRATRKLTMMEAVARVMRRKKSPANPFEVADEILDEGLIDSEGITPRLSITSAMYVDCGKIKGILEKCGPGKMRLRKAK